MSAPQPTSLPPGVLEFIAFVQTASLATLGPEGQPHCSYAPFLFDGGCFYIYTSQLALHTRNLLDHPQCELMLIEDEAATKNLFGRRRLMFTCLATSVSMNQERALTIIDAFEDKFGNVISVLRGLPDFMLFQLIPHSGNFIEGFGRATRFDLRRDTGPASQI